MKNYKKNKLLLEKTYNYKSEMEHDACGVGLIASINGKKSRKVVEYGIEALKAIWHRGAVDADGKSGDGAGIQIEIAPEFFKEKILATGHATDDQKRICVGMVFYLVQITQSRKNAEKLLKQLYLKVTTTSMDGDKYLLIQVCWGKQLIKVDLK